MAGWTDSEETQFVYPDYESALIEKPSPTGASRTERTASRRTKKSDRYGWAIPSALSFDPDEARACIRLPQFDALLLEKARMISEYFPLAQGEYRNVRRTGPNAP